jgi:hypothetical protein
VLEPLLLEHGVLVALGAALLLRTGRFARHTA